MTEMPELPSDSSLPVTVEVADAVARSTSANKIGVQATGGKLYLTHADKRTWVHLLPYQLSVRGIRSAIAENDPWPGE